MKEPTIEDLPKEELATECQLKKELAIEGLPKEELTIKCQLTKKPNSLCLGEMNLRGTFPLMKCS